MNNVLKNHANSPKAVTEYNYHHYSCQSSLLDDAAYMDDIQSSSVTSNGFLWQRRLAKLANESALVSSSHTLEEIQQNMLQEQKKQALLELLRSWREDDDEQEQRSTMEFLRKAIDEDRTSYRKIFP